MTLVGISNLHGCLIDDCQIKLSFVTSLAFWAVFQCPCCYRCVEELTWYVVFVLSFSGVQHRGS